MIVSIIGGGASGMLLSILVKESKPKYTVRVFERNDRVGKKLLATGNGRCNYTNMNVSKENFHSQNTEFPMKIINEFDNIQTIKLLKKYGIYPIEEKGGRVYPLSLQGSSVLDFLRFKMETLGVETILNEKINKVEKTSNGFLLKGEKDYNSDSVVIATGGMAMPQSGSDGIGYRLARELGHNVIDFGPTIVQLESDFKRIKELKGVRIDTTAKLLINGNVVDQESGDVLFTDYGISGPTILDLSRRAIEELNKNKKVEVSVNLIGLPKEEIQSMINERVENLEGISFENFFVGIINKKLIRSFKEMLIFEYNINYDIIKNNVDFAEKTADLLYDFKFNISGYKGFGNAQSTTGGVDTKNIKSTLESKIVDDLYFIGEVLDVDGDCGGYNLQWAWSSAYVAAMEIINKGR